ncbi:GH92 family glycosyl hydrolase [Leyella stercorea]|uniref:GH92 family glycosyl hydrolase n=1 Tax=Leyella stercorea TaxID=363265 RepID=UPI003F654CC9
MKLKTTYMNKSKRLLCKLAFAALGLLPTMATTALADTTDYTQYVNPFVGNADNGHTFPGACRPFGMIQTSPVTGAVGWRYCSEYVYSDSLIWGFTQTHLNGTGCMDLGDILVMPVSGKRTRAWDGYRSRYSKQQEFATPGYYSVYLTDAKVKAELTAAPHVAFHRYTFDNPDSTSVFIDLQHAPAWRDEQYHSQCISCETKWEDAQTLTGHVRNKVWVDQDYFFVMKFNRPVVSHIQLPKAVDTERGQRIVATFDIPRGEQLLVKVAMSTTSVEGARLNLETEVPDWNFAEVTRTAHNEWNSYLSRIDVTGTDTDKQNYYTAFYHALIQPNQIADVDGKYRNADNKVVRSSNGEFYSTFSCWDTYRAAHPFYTMVIPERVDGLVNSLVEQAEVQGFLPIWGLWGKENFCMIGNHAVSIVAEAYHKGFRGFDAERAFNAIKRTQTVSHGEKYDWETYMKYGYWPTDLIASESVSNSLECMYDDYAAADMARLMGKKQDQQYFARRANFYKNLFDKQTNFMRPRLADGSWRSPFNPSDVAHAETVGGDYTEGNAWQYTWQVQHDIPGLIKLFGGQKPFLKKLDEFFTLELITSQNDVTGLIGQYAHGNEPSHHVAYLYALAGRPSRTQELIREIFDTQYHPTVDGLCGNDDCGQMSAWYMLSAMGFYPVNPVSGEYVFGAPQMPKIVLHLPEGKTFTVVADGISAENKYVDYILLNGKKYNKTSISHNTIMQGGTLVYKMCSTKKHDKY